MSLTLSEVTCRYGQLTAVDRVDLMVRDGERHAVIGPNGAGKSTLLALIAGTVRPSTGRVLLDGRNLGATGPARRARAGIARTFQQPAVAASLTALDNVALAAWPRADLRGFWRPSRYRALRAGALDWLDRVGAADLADRPAGQLSHGQRRLVELAAALAGRPRLLLLDEPAAGLTDTESARLIAVLAGLPAEVAVVLVEHDLAFVGALAGRITVLHEGRVLAHGTPAAVGADPQVRSVYLGSREL
ncbi:branched-chain amino acid transport system ATP-binding protein [Kitasatospora sp. MAA4]|uniref:ABC transporter ATP-binding protein n=1 Tax=Kitasatospora sp. MAA4 TaxID=3035093 RepID=UPI002473CFE3|nr:ATP-binding cassette domain-containing protein [Kitasatospora sp. MAA4]MDH6132024.1 branched-chain amino acid transport system ATP-binding protein [Kitasatospora sp. MAA4]